ncbi:phage terminase large subunit [Gemmata obscuriglobus]|uniref:Terminase large subunit gp17-like C-terminal domain-containing protein n=1 Tax=Gemmata obscuriglobus TaxID=114 RepID=A0A2Z3H4J9_9BACT|nr:phage terminase large subunit [Gemmata obscuriglobus]AWM39791.1 hypothetical protein C1280_24150 [Gemmata obscuriglobus]
MAANRFRHFCELVWPAVRPEPFVGGYFVDALCEHLEAVHKGQIKRLALVCPVRHGKSVFTSVLWPAWCWITDPSIRFLSASATQDLVLRDSDKTRDIISHTVFQKHFAGLFNLSEKQDSKGWYKNDRGGERKAVGAGTRSTGLDAEYLIVDDLLDYDKARHEGERKAVLDFYANTLTNRLVYAANKDRIVLCGHRVHEDDVFNHVWTTFGNDGSWTYLYLPAEANPDLSNSYHNALGWKDTRKVGQLLHPGVVPLAKINEAKKGGKHKYHCLYNQDVTPADGDIFSASMFRYFTAADGFYNLAGKQVDAKAAWRFVAVDTAVSTESTADYSVIQVWDCIGGHLVLVHQIRKRLDGTKLVPAIASVHRTYNPQFVCVEEQFVGRFVIDQLRAESVPVKRFNAKGHGDKETRAVAAQIRMEAGSVWFPADQDWVSDLQKELLAFPASTHDDQVDALSMACILADKYTGKIEIELTPEEAEAKAKKDAEGRFQKMLWQGAPF